MKFLEKQKAEREEKEKFFKQFYSKWKNSNPLHKRLKTDFDTVSTKFSKERLESVKMSLKASQRSVGLEEILRHQKDYYKKKRVKSEANQSRISSSINNSFSSSHLFRSHFHKQIRRTNQSAHASSYRDQYEKRQKMNRFAKQVKEVIYPSMMTADIPLPRPHTTQPRPLMNWRKQGNDNLQNHLREFNQKNRSSNPRPSSLNPSTRSPLPNPN